MTIKKLLLMVALFASIGLVAQEAFPPVSISQGTLRGETIALRDAPLAQPWAGGELKGTINQKFVQGTESRVQGSPDGHDPLMQTEAPYHESINILQNFQGSGISESGGFIPPDPSGAVGPNHYVHAVNSIVKIFDKTGNVLVGPIQLGTFLGNGSNNGDPIVMYDQLADRYFVSQFEIATDALIIGISTTSDPTGTYNVYEFPLDAFPDYPHYGVWPDAYYLTANKFVGNTTYAFDRAAMIAGDPNPALVGFDLPGLIRNPNTVFGAQPANLLGTTVPAGAPGLIVYMQDDGWPGVSDDHLKVWEIDVNFGGTSTISAPQVIPVANFDSFFAPFGSGDLLQPTTNQKLDSQAGVVSYMANYRSFPGHNSFVLNFNSDLGAATSGIRWIELRNTGTGPFSLYQEGTWTIPDGVSRFMGSTAMDQDGNIALAYSVVSPETKTGLRFTGRLDGDPLGVMTFPETEIFPGGSYQSISNRYGDYAQMTLDPDGSTFWFTSQYFAFINSWATRIASFKIVSDLSNDVGAYSITSPSGSGPYTAAENVTVDLYNYGSSPQSNFDVELRFDGTLVATETFTGTIAPNTTEAFTFVQTVDMSVPNTDYEIEVSTDLSGDQLGTNDSVMKQFRDDVLSTNDVSLGEKGLLIYPIRDTRTYEIFYSTTTDYGNINYKVLDISGKVFGTGTLDKQSNGYKNSVNLSAAATGVYIVQITNGTDTTSKQILVR